MTVEDLHAARLRAGPWCPVCGDIDCRGIRSLISCDRLWADENVSRIEYQSPDDERLAIEFDRCQLQFEIDDEDE